MGRLFRLIWLLAALWGGLLPAAQGSGPPLPRRWVTDGPGLLTPGTRAGLDQRLEAYQRGTGHQVLVWIGTGTGGIPLEDWTVQAFAAWKPGRSGADDGLVLFVFTADHKIRMEVGYGLEGQMPDAVAAAIIRETIAPALGRGDPDGALNAGVDRVLQTLGGETGARPAQAQGQSVRPWTPLRWFLLGGLGLALLVLAVTHPGLALWLLSSLLSGGGRGGGGSGGGFSGGGGRSGGGGASGSW